MFFGKRLGRELVHFNKPGLVLMGGKGDARRFAIVGVGCELMQLECRGTTSPRTCAANTASRPMEQHAREPGSLLPHPIGSPSRSVSLARSQAAVSLPWRDCAGKVPGVGVALSL